MPNKPIFAPRKMDNPPKHGTSASLNRIFVMDELPAHAQTFDVQLIGTGDLWADELNYQFELLPDALIHTPP